MLKATVAHQFKKILSSGRTRPCILTCFEIQSENGEAEEDEELDLVVKFSGGCDRGTNALIAEVFAALLAADLELPVPEPHLVLLSPEFIEVIPDPAIHNFAKRSSRWAYGARLLPTQFSSITSFFPLDQNQAQTAAEIIAFDVLISNIDRRVINPNCLFNGKDFAIFDHELAFKIQDLIGWAPPWEANGVFLGIGDNEHALLSAVRGRRFNFQRLLAAFQSVSSKRIEEYFEQIPPDWSLENETAQAMMAYIRDLRTHCARAIEQIEIALR